MVAAATEQRSEVPMRPQHGHVRVPGVAGKQDGSPCAAADEHGYVKDDNNVAQQFNDELKDRVNKLRAKYPGAAITLVDVYSAKYSLFVNPNSQGIL